MISASLTPEAMFLSHSTIAVSDVNQIVSGKKQGKYFGGRKLR
jgi:hypothetical protein